MSPGGNGLLLNLVPAKIFSQVANVNAFIWQDDVAASTRETDSGDCCFFQRMKIIESASLETQFRASRGLLYASVSAISTP